jgi:hypothetical protein
MTMSDVANSRHFVGGISTHQPPAKFVGASLVLAAGSALLAGWTPVLFSIATVFLFAGPHNWIETRYFFTRLPARWGKLRPFFLVAFIGILGLTATFAALPPLLMFFPAAPAVWASVLITWVAVLVQMRGRTNPRRDWGWTMPLAVGLIGVAWLSPAIIMLGVIYLHPCLALWILDGELRRRRPEWQAPYRKCLVCLPILLGALWWKLATAPDLAGDDGLARRITGHAGALVLPGVSSHLLVATHAFLEMIHYSVWTLAIPFIGLRTAPWRLGDVPLAQRNQSWNRAVGTVLGSGAVVVLVLWGCFAVDYATTRDVYFTVALLHVLAEVPFLLRTL